MADNNELERTLWAAADKLRYNMDAAEYKHVVLGLIFLKYISDAFNDLHEKLKEGKGEFEGADPEDRGRIPGPQYLLRARESPLAVPSGPRQAAGDRQAR